MLRRILGLLTVAQQTVQDYRKAEIARHKEDTPYLQGKNKERALRRFRAKLPNVDTNAIEIVGKALATQKSYAENVAWNLCHPRQFIGTKALDHALHYSTEHWIRITEDYFKKSEQSAAWAKASSWIDRTYAKRLEEAQKVSVEAALATARQQFIQWRKELEAEHHLSPEKRQELQTAFINRITSLKYV